MKKNKKKILIFGVIACIFSLILNIVNIQVHKISEPIVLEHYLEVSLHDEIDLSINYITNRRDSIKINRIYFPKYDLTFYDKNFQDTNSLKYYNSNTAVLNTRLNLDQQKEYEEMDNIILEDAVITYNNGLEQNIDIGKIIINNNKEKGLHSTMSSSSSTGFSKTVFELDNSIIINDITSELYEETHNFVKMNLVTNDELDNTLVNISKETDKDKIMEMENNYHNNQKDIVCYPVDELQLPFQAYNTLSVNTNFEMLDNDCKYNVYDIRYTLLSTDENGNEGSQSLYNIRYSPYFTDKLVKELVKKRGL
ncbi:hypothetical protein [Vallitalea guaymasensis]|uniref:Uncharacterized protein n=1 Tax=Vallitalea guaymasensis TaxID=1185412 RepID=A0A8J8MAA3_9FIRM|nr:hypothetical protein [Vallitalea guaymasensis]QUH29226.1 hypothetical protein HYG85_09925 [Vallitalea guaymasensis]